jgi:hypothetical protein
MRGCFASRLAGGDNFHLDPFGGVTVVFSDAPPNGIKVFGSL